ncbi:cyclopropane fatty acyl phospholipid synthase [Providencia hangzhouensis]|uniref:Cyclopropane fatty acyl phospholipid synthase n=1 Tax=Providencia rettgeri TaxID=587 RepID=A0AAJ4TJ68_PRORE|nr:MULTISPECIES: cyclopropane fatty acyl phospholipid synthase [Providencia]MBJ9971687.1 cyclopropane fatty acyl phospholipid synthase [Providencia rettgeri]MCF8963220.1 Cyclopropane-fatty-acyl-phospholipid synthase [Providencia rettgeri]QWQ17977.1 cyclopropane fatty acyl phospholipid synthase [Providencia rettgeri]QWQ21811.1 cyclopropane fatty acyl phospholipid synthase [Providencia rettgeri]QWQ25650.1 cyclopropane fatty acyl phospholipid synthase [Providencia rettgeri]
MSTEQVVNQKNTIDSWQRIAAELLSEAGIKINGSRPFDIQVHNHQFFKRVLQQGSLGLGESYMDGWWDCERLDIFFQHVLRHKLDKKIPHNFSDTLKIAVARVRNLQTLKRARIVGEEHYDLGNDLFSLMLDPYMQYSCGYWKGLETVPENLPLAQEQKLNLICEKLQLKPDMRLLDIGCGWGGLAAYAAKNYGVSVTGVTISAEQQKYAQARCAGLDVDIKLDDYRNLNDQFDRIVSVGMFEHVGPKNYATYFDVIQRNLKTNGLFLLHTIGSNQNKVNVDPWTNKYIFPNGCLPSVQNIGETSEGKLVMEDWHNFGADYDHTLMAWYSRFQAAWSELEDNYTPRFKRMFSYYLNACAGAFRARDIQLWQILWSPQGVTGGLRVAR